MTTTTLNGTNVKDEVCWYVMRAYRCEAKAEQVLSGEHGLPFFIPKRYVLTTYHGKKVKRLVPVINSLLFVRASRTQLAEFKQRFPFIQYVMWKKSSGLEFLKVPDKEMENFIKVAQHTEEEVTYYAPEEINLKTGTRIRVLGGAFDGAEGYFVKVKGKRNRRLVVNLDGIAAVSAEVSPDLVEIIK